MLQVIAQTIDPRAVCLRDIKNGETFEYVRGTYLRLQKSRNGRPESWVECYDFETGVCELASSVAVIPRPDLVLTTRENCKSL